MDLGRFELQRLGTHFGFSTDVSMHPHPGADTQVATMRGLLRGVALAVQRFPHSRGFSDGANVAFWPPLDLGLTIRREGTIAGKLRDLLGSQDVLTGDEAFDAPLRIQADEPDDVRALLTPIVRHKIHWFAGSCNRFELSDAGIQTFTSGAYGPRNWPVELPALVDIAIVLRDVARELPPARGLAAWVEPLRNFASAYGMRYTPRPLACEGDLGNLTCGVFFRRISAERFAIELGAVIAPLGPFQVAIHPRRPRLKVAAFELAKPTDAPQPVSPLFGMHHPDFIGLFDMTAVRPRFPDVHMVVPPAITAKMVELHADFDVEIRHGVLTLRREITNEDPASLASWIDRAADGARVVVKQAAAGYRD